eukprot:jgi/Mesvir1/22756/Mv14155-RA.1
MAGREDKDYFQDYKNVPPSQLIAERGANVLVINPGSSFLRIGLASQTSPVEIPHCIARYCTAKQASAHVPRVVPQASLDAREALCRKLEASLGWVPPSAPSNDADASTGAEVCTLLPEAEDSGWQWTTVRTTPAAAVAGKTLTGDGTGSAQGPAGSAPIGDAEDGARQNGADSTPAVADADGDWDREAGAGGDVTMVDAQDRGGAARSGPPASSPDHGSEDGGFPTGEGASSGEDGCGGQHGDNYGGQLQEDGEEEHPDDDDGMLDAPPVALGVVSALVPPRSDVSQQDGGGYRRWVVGEEAARVSPEDPYVLRWPMRRGKFNVGAGYSLQQVLDDMHAIWEKAIRDDLQLTAKDREELAVVLVVPDTLETREVKELIGLILKDLAFASMIIHQESVAACIGNNISSACIVNVGAQTTVAACVEDGSIVPGSRLVMPFGGDDLTRSALWFVKRGCAGAFPYAECNPWESTQDFLILQELLLKMCTMGAAGDTDRQPKPWRFRVRKKGEPARCFQAPVGSLRHVLALGLTNPLLLDIFEEDVEHGHGRHHEDFEDTLDDAYLVELAPSRRIDALNKQFAEGAAMGGMVGLPVGGEGAGLLNASIAGTGASGIAADSPAPMDTANVASVREMPAHDGSVRGGGEDGLTSGDVLGATSNDPGGPSSSSAAQQGSREAGQGGGARGMGSSGAHAASASAAMVSESLLSVPRMIVKSILSSGRLDLKRKMFASIQLVGGTVMMKGVIDVLEESTLAAIPEAEDVEMVEILPLKVSAKHICWRGGAVMGAVDFARENWIQRSDWMDRGVQVGLGRKYRDSVTFNTFLSYYTQI